MERKKFVGILVVFLTALIAVTIVIVQMNDGKKDVEILLEEMERENEKYDEYVRAYVEASRAEDKLAMLERANQAYDQAKKLEDYYYMLPVPREVPEHVLSIFEGLSSDLSVAFFERAKAFQLILTYLDKDDEAVLQEAEERFHVGDEYFLMGSDNIDLIKEQMGLE